MVDAYTFQSGNESKSFKSRAEMFDWMVENGHTFLDGETATKFRKHVEARLATKTIKQGQESKFSDALKALDYNLVE